MVSIAYITETTHPPYGPFKRLIITKSGTLIANLIRIGCHSFALCRRDIPVYEVHLPSCPLSHQLIYLLLFSGSPFPPTWHVITIFWNWLFIYSCSDFDRLRSLQQSEILVVEHLSNKPCAELGGYTSQGACFRSQNVFQVLSSLKVFTCNVFDRLIRDRALWGAYCRQALGFEE